MTQRGAVRTRRRDGVGCASIAGRVAIKLGKVPPDASGDTVVYRFQPNDIKDGPA